MASYTADELLDFAIDREQEAHDLYMDLAGRAEQFDVKTFLTQLAGEELTHKAKLEEVKSGRRPFAGARDVADLHISDYLAEVAPSGSLDYQDALILAIKREEASRNLYTDLARLAADKELKTVFLALAEEEGKHKHRFEIAYRYSFREHGSDS